ncbi:hypothetical protein FA15DRAFT_659173 [Coprinopsis marcescibilis]|uniref:Uncharacterized protein n=1 Tax=Coprinopsis marcescibilis TaxID=230819 RepID=A0A5C3KJI7_COPMA|nr:hypothetical protein FA15DRAFT_659173 [Coprinopsis marcescibilis]
MCFMSLLFICLIFEANLCGGSTKKTPITTLVPVVTASGALATKDVKDEEDDPFAPFIAKDDNNNLMDLSSIRVITLPESCKVTLEHVKDLYLVLIGHYDNLPNLRLCSLTTWKNSGQLENHETKVMSVHGWMKCVPNMSKEKLVQGLMFERAGDYFNPSVADPWDFKGVFKEEMIAQVVGTMLTFQTQTKDLNAASSGRSKGNTNKDPVSKELEGHTSTYDSPIKTHPSCQGFVPYSYNKDDGLKAKLPVWKGEVPIGACCTVSYISQSYTWNSSLHLKLYLQWVIVIGSHS